MTASAWRNSLLAYLVAVLYFVPWPWTFWLVAIAGFRRGRRACKAFLISEAERSKRKRQHLNHLDELARLARGYERRNR